MSRSTATATSEVALASQMLDDWIEKEGFLGWDPHDALNSPVLRGIARQNRFLGIALLQFLRRSPINLRRLLKVRKGYNPKAMGLFLKNYADKFFSTHNVIHLRRVQFFSEWLLEHSTPGFAGPCWGYNFDWPNRGFFAPAGTPTVVNTAFIALSFLDAEAALNCSSNLSGSGTAGSVQAEREQRPESTVDALSVARGACEFILRDLNVLRASASQICFSYTPLDRRFVHNANLLGAWLLAAVYARTGEKVLAERAREAARFSVRCQRLDGSWPYGTATRDRWVDNFHTGYVLMSLKHIGRCLKTDEFEGATSKGYEFWKERMFLANSIPKYYPEKVYPIDVHCVAQAILTFLEFADCDPEATRRAWRLALWAVKHMQDPSGFFYYQVCRNYKNRTPYMRWSQAWVQRALTALNTHRSLGLVASET
jgi:hypothetical protein